MVNVVPAIFDAEIANQSQANSSNRLRKRFISDKVSFNVKLNVFADMKLT